ncbi:MAG TPA: sulfite exporter TauE/SafE family protein, partial [Burkholderiales bacterium]|nr:sulfite exporter TauE/SafE family protein [Burkholderiales bacterium]
GEALIVLSLTAVVLGASLLAGVVGALTGLGGGVVIVPFLTLALGVDIRYAVGASLISVIATSSGAASAYVKEGFSNIRVGMFLELGTTLGAIGGAFLAAAIRPAAIAVVFGLVLIGNAATSLAARPGETPRPPEAPDRLASRLRMDGEYPSLRGPVRYHVRRVPGGLGLMSVAGALSGLLGIGSGALKVIAMDKVMRMPFKVSTATSNFMIGVTAASSAGIYLRRGYIDPGLTMPVMLGVLAGSLVGARVLARTPTRRLRWLFDAVIFALGVEMIFNGLAGQI